MAFIQIFFFGLSFSLLGIRTEADLKQSVTGQDLPPAQANCQYNSSVFDGYLSEIAKKKKCLRQIFTPINERVPGEGNNVKLNICQQLL